MKKVATMSACGGATRSRGIDTTGAMRRAGAADDSWLDASHGHHQDMPWKSGGIKLRRNEAQWIAGGLTVVCTKDLKEEWVSGL